jgi:hypothetical protein
MTTATNVTIDLDARIAAAERARDAAQTRGRMNAGWSRRSLMTALAVSPVGLALREMGVLAAEPDDASVPLGWQLHSNEDEPDGGSGDDALSESAVETAIDLEPLPTSDGNGTYQRFSISGAEWVKYCTHFQTCLDCRGWGCSYRDPRYDRCEGCRKPDGRKGNLRVRVRCYWYRTGSPPACDRESVFCCWGCNAC